MNSKLSKRPKLEEPSVDTPDTSIWGGSPKKKFSSSEFFRDVRYTDHFIDKTLLIPTIFETNAASKMPVVLITAPRRFGKSVNMSMTESFLEKQVDKFTGAEIPSDDENSNTKLFEDLKIMGPEYREFRDEHFGNYAILKASFLCMEPIQTKRDAMNFCKRVIHNAYEAHPYLLRSGELNDDQKGDCRRWCDNRDYDFRRDNLIVDGLKNLSRYLYIHYKRKLKVFVLIDEYDSMYMQAMSSVKDQEDLKSIISHSIGMIGNLVKGNEFVAGAFLTGISHIACLGLSSSLGRISSYRFLKNDEQNSNRFVEFYGFTRDEVQVLFRRFDIPIHKRNQAEVKYNGYQSKDGSVVVYNTWSIVNFLEEGVADNYWTASGAVQGLSFAFKIDEIKTELERTFLNSKHESRVRILNNLEEVHFYALHSMIQQTGNLVVTPSVFFTFLLEQGYLSYSGSDGLLKIPNREVRRELHVKLAEHTGQVYGIPEHELNQCRTSIQNVFSSIPAETSKLNHLLLDLKNNLEALVLPLKKTKLKVVNHDILQQVLFGPVLATGYDYATEIQTEEKRKPNFFLFKDNVGMLVEIKIMCKGSDNRNNSSAALRQVLEKMYYCLLSDDNYLKKPASSYLLIGLSFNEDLQVSMCSMKHCRLKNL